MKRVITINSNDLEKSLYTKELLTKKLEENNFLVSSKLEENTEEWKTKWTSYHFYRLWRPGWFRIKIS